MTTSHSWKCFQVLFSLLILQFVSTTETTTETLKNDKAKVEFRNLSFPHLTESFFKPFNGNLALVKISECKIEKIDKRAFDGMKHLNFLEVSDSEIKDKIDSQTFSRVSTLEVLILKNVGLRDLNLNLTNVQELILSHNNIEDFKEDAIKGPNVNYLDVSNNKIEKLERGFRSMGKLSMIDISKNKIAHVGNGTFKHNHNLVRILASENQLKSTDGLKLPKLKTLDLFSNKITTLKSNAFEKMSFLEELVLAFNGIEIVEDPFKDLTELKFLNLAWNSIEQLPAGLFQNNLYLSHLSLQGNKLKSLTRFADSLDRLDKLDLSHNKIAYIEEEFFSAMPNLSILDLNFNGLKVLTNVFQPLKNLRVLNLAHNDIVLIGFEFSNNHLMTRLNLSSNNIDIGWGLFKNNTQLTSLDLSNNGISFFCDADVTLEKLRKINLSGNRNRDLGCLKGKNFQTLCQIDLRNNPLTCGKDLDDLILSFTMKKSSPYQIMKEIQLDAVQSQW